MKESMNESNGVNYEWLKNMKTIGKTKRKRGKTAVRGTRKGRRSRKSNYCYFQNQLQWNGARDALIET